MSVTIYHNPRCSKSRQALAILTEGGAELEVVDYLNAPLDAASLVALRDKMGLETRAMMRTGEAIYKELNLKQETEDAKLVQAMAEHPILMERPVVVSGSQALIARPPELAEQFL
ncbi:MAG: arsenate reductase (glutaredoxin) [Alphaproteobacteria bacterium]|jgi:arsenate reductase|nr:arsenate reductase (glutaredoxin) [Alphaproteobacteria bacterium]